MHRDIETMSDRYHRAAIDGRIDILSRGFISYIKYEYVYLLANRRQLNRANVVDGRTCTHLAAQYGQLHALRIIIGRG